MAVLPKVLPKGPERAPAALRDGGRQTAPKPDEHARSGRTVHRMTMTGAQQATGTTVAQTLRGASIAVIVAGLAVVVGTLMTWVTFSGGFLVLDRSGVNYDADAKWMIVLAVLAVLGAVGELADVAVLPSFIRTSAIWDGLLVTILGVYAISQLNDKIRVAQAAGADGHIGAGVYVSIAGGALMLVSGLRLWDVRRKVKRATVASSVTT